MAEEPSDLTVVRQNDVSIVTIRCENLLGIPEVNGLCAQLHDLLERGERKLVVNLENVQYAGSAALGMLLSIDQELKSAGGKLVLAHSDKIEGLLKVSRTRAVFSIAKDVDGAVGMM